MPLYKIYIKAHTKYFHMGCLHYTNFWLQTNSVLIWFIEWMKNSDTDCVDPNQLALNWLHKNQADLCLL